MNDFLRERYETARNTYLHELAYINQKNEQYAEQNGGESNLDATKQKVFNARKASLIKLVSFHDTTQEYIEYLESWISEIIQEKRTAEHQLSTAQDGWLQYFPRLTKMNESQKEHSRKMSIISLQMRHPELF